MGWKISAEDIQGMTDAKFVSSEHNALYCTRGAGIVRVAIDSATHGQEYAGPLALAWLAGLDWAARWPHLRGLLYWSDLDGLGREGYGFVSVSGKAGPNLPMAGSRWNRHDMWIAYDRNSLWGSVNEESLPEGHWAQRRRLTSFHPDYAIALHETNDEPQDAPFVGEGLLLIEEFPLSYEELMAVRGEGVFAPVLDWASGMLKLPAWWRTALALRNNSANSLFGEAAKTYAKAGGRLIGSLYLELLQGYAALGQGRVMAGRNLLGSEWLTFTGYCLSRFGAPGVTLETFVTNYVGLRGIEERAETQVAYVTALLDGIEAQAA